MLDYITSKMVWIIAAIILTSSVLGVFNWQRRAAEELVLEQRAESIAELVNKVISTHGDLKLSVSFDSDEKAHFHFDPTANGMSYGLNISISGLSLSQGQRSVWKNFVSGVHLYNPVFIHDEGMIDTVSNRTQISVSERFYIESKEYSGRYHVFIYHETSDDMITQTEDMGSTIQNKMSWEFDTNTSAINSTEILTMKLDTVFHRNYFFFSENHLVPYPISSIYLFKPENYSYREHDLSELDQGYVSVIKGSNIVLERRLISLEGYHCVAFFLYPESTTG